MKTKGLNTFQLKLLMAFLMVFDHLDKIPGLLSGMGWYFSCFDTLCCGLVCFCSSGRFYLYSQPFALQFPSLFLGCYYVYRKYSYQFSFPGKKRSAQQ